MNLDDKEQGEGKGDANEKYREHNLSEDMSKIEKYYNFQHYQYFKEREISSQTCQRQRNIINFNIIDITKIEKYYGRHIKDREIFAQTFQRNRNIIPKIEKYHRVDMSKIAKYKFFHHKLGAHTLAVLAGWKI